QVLEMVAAFRREDDRTPVVLMGYANPIERMGQQAFCDAAQAAGVDGLLVVDYPPEESGEFARMLAAANVDPIFLLAPTSTEARIQAVAKVARGYVYYVSLKGVTGAGHLDTGDVARRLDVIRRHVSIPVGVGFGIRDPESARKLSECADAVVIGSKIIETMEAATQSALAEGASPQACDARAIEAAAGWRATVRAVRDGASADAGRPRRVRKHSGKKNELDRQDPASTHQSQWRRRLEQAGSGRSVGQVPGLRVGAVQGRSQGDAQRL